MPRAVQFEGTLSQRANQNPQQFWIDGVFRTNGRGSVCHACAPGRASASLRQDRSAMGDHISRALGLEEAGNFESVKGFYALSHAAAARK
jgi:hypothetical protein